jgi:polysaccharide biosynthesis protein PslG
MHGRLPTRITAAGPAKSRRDQAVVALASLLWVAAVVFAALHSNGGGGPRAAPLPRIACAGPEIGVHSALAFEGDPERRAETVDAIQRDLHPQVVRDGLLWNLIEPVRGRRNWSRVDSIVEELRAAGIEPLLVVSGSPSWANGVPETTRRHEFHVPPRGAAFDAWLYDYADFLAEAVRRYHDFVRRWEIWNEPNLSQFWRPRPNPVAYRQVYETLRATILRVDPTAEVAVGGLGGLSATSAPSITGLKFLRHLTRARAPMDAVAIHAYSGYADHAHPPWVHVPNENNFDNIERVRDHLLADGERASIWVTEWGWSSASVGEGRQALYVKRSLQMLEHRYRFVRVATYFLDRDLPPRFFQGLLDEHLNPKPAARVFRGQAELAASRCHTKG